MCILKLSGEPVLLNTHHSALFLRTMSKILLLIHALDKDRLDENVEIQTQVLFNTISLKRSQLTGTESDDRRFDQSIWENRSFNFLKSITFLVTIVTLGHLIQYICNSAVGTAGFDLPTGLK